MMHRLGSALARSTYCRSRPWRLVRRLWHGRDCNAQFSTGEMSHRSLDQTFRVAVVGSGPAGFYTSYRLMALVPGAHVDMYESLPVPFGLVRYGVAPDHPEVKNCQEKFEEVARSPRFRFIGNVAVGQPNHDPTQGSVDLSTISGHYHAIVLGYGAAQDKELGIPGESTLSGIYSARQFVGWYNGLPEQSSLSPSLNDSEDAVIIGHGNVALDVARILLTHVDVLRKTDIAEAALEHLARSRIKRVSIVGRRGPMQVSFSAKEIRELLAVPSATFLPIDHSLMPPDLKTLPRPSRRLMEVMLRGSKSPTDGESRLLSLDFCLSPQKFVPRTSTIAAAAEASPARVGSTFFAKTQLYAKDDPTSASKPTGESASITSDVVFRSTGYKSKPLVGFAEAGLHFDFKVGVVANDGMGRALRPSAIEPGSNRKQPISVPGYYCTGWVKRGPTGVIASTMQDAFTSAEIVAQDWLSGGTFLGEVRNDSIKEGWEGVRRESPGLDAIRVVNWGDWRQIDQAERERGRGRDKVREKFTSTTEMLAVLA